MLFDKISFTSKLFYSFIIKTEVFDASLCTSSTQVYAIYMFWGSAVFPVVAKE
jgi:hypothetical protein